MKDRQRPFGPQAAGRTFLRPLISTAAFACLFALPVCSLAAPPAAVPGEVLVTLRPEKDTQYAPKIFADLGHTIGRHPGLHAQRIKLRPGVSIAQAIAAYKKRDGVLAAEPNYIRHCDSSPNDPDYPQQYAPGRIQADVAWDLWNPRQQVVVGLIDSGVDNTHPDLTNQLLRDGSGNIVGYNAITGNPGTAADDYGHGTHCAGVIAAQADNDIGVAGIGGWNKAFGIKVMPVKVLNSNGDTDDGTLSDGITWAVNHGAKVLSISIGGPSSSYILDTAIQYAWSQGCVVVSSAGNNNTSTVQYPAGSANVLAVAATDSNDTIAGFSNFGSWVQVAAPGVSVLSTLPTYPTAGNFGQNYGWMNGTSMACPHVAAEAAILFAQNPSLTNAQVKQLIITQVDPYSGNALAPGAGRINVAKALAAATPASSPSVALTSLVAYSAYGPATVTSNKVTLSGPASTPVTISLTSSNPAISVPGAVTVPAGASSTTFSTQVNAVAGFVYGSITATFNGKSFARTLIAFPDMVASVSVSPNSAKGGSGTITGQIRLIVPALAGSVTVLLSSNNPAVTLTTPSVTIPAGKSTASFTLTTSPVTADTVVTLSAHTALAGSAVRSTQFTVKAH